jgi:uncharacterized protein (TIGR00369 family)
MADTARNADRFEPLAPAHAARWAEFPGADALYFPRLVGLQLEEVRRDYARMRLPYRPELRQPGGIVHGGAIATLIDTVVVPAIASGYTEPRSFVTISLSTHFLAAVAEQDAVAEGWVERRGRSVVFCRVEVRSARGELSATASVVYKVGKPLPAAA